MNHNPAADESSGPPPNSDGCEAETGQMSSQEEVRDDSTHTEVKKRKLIERFHEAVKSGDIETVKSLLSEGICVDTEDSCYATPLQYAVMSSNLKIAKLLLDWGADVNASGFVYAIIIASAYSDAEMVKLLLSKGARVNVETADWHTPLHCAAAYNKLEIAELLCDRGVDVNVRSDTFTPLHSAALYGQPEMYEFLLRKGALVNARNEEGKTPLHCTVLWNRHKTSELLLDWGADVNAADNNGHTPLDCVKFLWRDMTESTAIIDRILKRHIIKMKALNSFVSDKNLQAVYGDGEMAAFQLECEEEMERLKKEHICGTFALFDVLTRDAARCARLLTRRESIDLDLDTNDYVAEFPIYGRFVNVRFRVFVERKKSLEWGYKHFDSLLPLLPSDCVGEILDFLSNEDLKNCCEADL